MMAAGWPQGLDARRGGRVQPRISGHQGARKLKAIDVPDVSTDLFTLQGVPGRIRSDDAPEIIAKSLSSIAKSVQDWTAAIGTKTAYIAPGSPWENGHVEAFNARLRDERLNGEVFTLFRKARIIIESWRQHYSTVRPHGSIGCEPPAPEVHPAGISAGLAARPRPAPPAR